MYDIDGIKSQFKSVITYSQGIFNPQVDSLFAMWEKAKAPFIERFGGLIYEWPGPVEFILDPMEKKRKALEFIECVSCTFDNIPLADFLDSNIDTFFENKVSKSENKDIPEGMKLIKAFKFFESNKQDLEKWKKQKYFLFYRSCIIHYQVYYNLEFIPLLRATKGLPLQINSCISA